MLIHVHPEGTVELVLPRWVSKAAGDRFLQEQHAWIARAASVHASKRARVQAFKVADGESLPCFGNSMREKIYFSTHLKRSSVIANGDTLTIRAKDINAARRMLEGWYKREAREYFSVQAQEFAEALGVSISSVRAISMKTQWGSCNKKTRSITFNWRLALAPEEVARYVAAHEVAHLLHPNHARVFWNTVARIYPEHHAQRVWLQEYGGALFLTA